jgi:hypothetical protein
MRHIIVIVSLLELENIDGIKYSLS